MKILDVPVKLEIVIIPNPNREYKIEGSIELSAKGKKVSFDYYFNNRDREIMVEGHEIDISIVDKIIGQKHNLKYTYPDKNLWKIDFRIRELWKLVQKTIALLAINPLLQNKDAGIVYNAIEMVDKGSYQTFFDPF